MVVGPGPATSRRSTACDLGEQKHENKNHSTCKNEKSDVFVTSYIFTAFSSYSQALKNLASSSLHILTISIFYFTEIRTRLK